MNNPIVIIITGSWATGKTKMLQELSKRLRIPGFSRDTYKEARYDRGERGDFGKESYDALFQDLLATIHQKQSCIIESDFAEPEPIARLKELLLQEKIAAIQVHLVAHDRVLHERIIHRIASGERHPGHGDERFLQESKEALEVDGVDTLVRAPIDLPAQLLEIDTSHFNKIDYENIAHLLKQRIEGEREITTPHPIEHGA